MLPTPTRVIERLLASLYAEGGCLLSTYSRGSHGYVQIGWWQDGRSHTRLGHRVLWEAEHGPIPDGLTVDHGGACRNPGCLDTAHMRLMPNVDNARDNATANRLAAQTHCLRGHRYTPETTRIDRNGWRSCLTCRREMRAAGRWS